MKATLTIEASPAVLASILASLPQGAAVSTAAALDGGDDEDGPANLSAPAVDTTGLPWDERIHAKTKATNADGSWRGRRGVAKETVTQIEAELRAVQPAPPAIPAPVAPGAVTTTVPMPVPPPPATMPVAVNPAAPPPAVTSPAPAPVPPMPAPEPVAPTPAPVATTAPPAAEGIDFGTFMQYLTGQMAKQDAAGQQLVPADYLAGICAEISNAWAGHGVAPLTNITEIASNPALITYAVQLMQRDGKWS